MSNRVCFAAIAAAGLFASVMSAPAIARGGGGFGGRAGFATHGTRSRTTTVVTQRANGVTTRTRTTTTTTSTTRPAATSRAVSLIRPEVISVPATFGTGALVPPFSGVPIVPPFGATTAVAQFGRLPTVTTPYGGVPGFGYGAWLQPEASAFVEPSSVVATPAAVASGSGTAAAGPAAAAPSPQAACHPVANGYHCDWPS